MLKAQTKLLGIALPLALVITVVALLLAGGVPQVGPMPDLLAYAFELAPRTMYAIAIGGSTAVSMNLTGMNIGNDHRCVLMLLASEKGARSWPAFRVLALESACWLLWGVLWAHVYIVWQG